MLSIPFYTLYFFNLACKSTLYFWFLPTYVMLVVFSRFYLSLHSFLQVLEKCRLTQSSTRLTTIPTKFHVPFPSRAHGDLLKYWRRFTRQTLGKATYDFMFAVNSILGSYWISLTVGHRSLAPVSMIIERKFFLRSLWKMIPPYEEWTYT